MKKFNALSLALTALFLLSFQCLFGSTDPLPDPLKLSDILMDNICSDSGSIDPEGTLFDSGGQNSGYNDGENCSFLIAPGCALSLTVNFTFFETESCCDYLRIYDGEDENAPLLLNHSGSFTPTSVTANSGMAYVVFTSDGSVTAGGFELHWTSEIPSSLPVADFSMTDNNPPLNTPIQFVDQTTNAPNYWTWDFGDGNTSDVQSPFHTFTTPGTYNVQLIADNCFGQDTITRQITVQEAPDLNLNPPNLDLILECGQDTSISIVLPNEGAGDLVYDVSQIGGLFSATSMMNYDFNGASTTHIFNDIPASASYINLQIVLNGDFESNFEFANLYIEGLFIGQIDDGNIPLGNDIIVNYQFDAATIAPWLGDGSFSVVIENSFNVDISGFPNSDFHRVTVVTPASNWLSFSPETGTVVAGDDGVLNITISTEGLVAGAYEENLTLRTNDPNQTEINLPVTLQVVGEPTIEFSAACLDFPLTMQYRSSTLPLIISNTGCANLEITDILTNSPAFSWSFDQIVLEPGESDTLLVTYMPVDAGTLTVDLEIVNNAMPVSVCLNASSFLAPIISADSSSITVELFGCSDSLTVPLTVTNIGGSPLNYQFSSAGASNNLSLDSVRTRLNTSFEELTNLLPDFYLFFEGETGHFILDGGNDMYDGGNYLSVNNSFNYLTYSNDVIVSNAELGSGGRYFTRKYPGLFVFAADINGVNTFEISGDLGADGSGFVTATTLTYNFGLNTYTGFVKKVHDAFDPSVHQLIIVKNAPTASHTYETQTFNDTHQVLGLENVSRIYYLLFAEATGGEYTNTQIEAVMIRFLELVETASFLDLPTGDFSLDVNQSETFDITFSSVDRIDGVYQQNIVIGSNDPQQPELFIPVTMTIFGVPEIALSDTCLDFPSTMQYRTHTIPMVISNPGCDTLNISNMVVSDPEFSLSFSQTAIEPGQADTVMVTFSPLTAGTFTGTVELINDAIPISFCLTAEAFDAPSILTDPENLSIDLFSCADTVVLPITILNTGAGDLEYSFAGTNTGSDNIPLDSVRTRLNESFNDLTDLLPNFFLFEEGETGITINDGGDDMYDGGNFLHVNNSFNYMPYSNDEIQGFADLGNGGQYFTRKYPGLFVFAADMSGVSTFNITGNLGADGSGQVNTATFVQAYNGATYKGFVKKVYGTSDPSVNHLIIVKNGSNTDHNYDITSEADDHEVTGLTDVSRIYYLLFAGTSGLLYTDLQTQALMQRFLEIVEGYGFAGLPEGSFQLNSGQSETFNIPFYSQNTNGGTYLENIVIQSNDPLQPTYLLPVTVNVSFDLCANFEFTRPIECGGQINFISTTVNEPTSYLWDFGDGQFGTGANPSHYYNSPGSYTVTLSVSNAVSTDNITKVVEIDETSAPIEACNVVGTNNFPYAEITSFSLNTISNFTGSSNSTYSDFTCDFNTTLIVGIPYDLSVSTESGGDQDVKLWIDLNNSGTFDLNELLYAVDNNNSPHTGTITIPNLFGNVYGIPLRCRLATDDEFYVVEACSAVNVGEIEDYTVIIEPNTLPPTADFAFEILDPCQGLVQFTDLSGNLPTYWNWSFSDGGTSTAQNPIHIFEEAGVYTVSLSSGNAFGVGAISYNITINALNPSIGLINPPPLVNVPLTFTGNAVGGISWLWNFGDGNTATEANPTHTYEEEGTYAVSLTVSNGIGCQRTVSIEITVVVTDVDQVEKGFLIYPNPSTGDFLIDNQSGLPFQSIEVFNAMGQLVHRNGVVQPQSDPFPLTLHHLADGIYFLHIQLGDKRQVIEKIIIQK